MTGFLIILFVIGCLIGTAVGEGVHLVIGSIIERFSRD